MCDMFGLSLIKFFLRQTEPWRSIFFVLFALVIASHFLTVVTNLKNAFLPTESASRVENHYFGNVTYITHTDCTHKEERNSLVCSLYER